MHVRVLNRVWSCRRASKRNHLIQQLQLELRICIVPREFRPSSLASKKIRARASLRRHPGIRCSLHPPRFLACRARSRLSSPSSCASSSTRRRSTTPWRRPRKCQRAASVRGPPLCRSRPCTRSRAAQPHGSARWPTNWPHFFRMQSTRECMASLGQVMS